MDWSNHQKEFIIKVEGMKGSDSGRAFATTIQSSRLQEAHIQSVVILFSLCQPVPVIVLHVSDCHLVLEFEDYLFTFAFTTVNRVPVSPLSTRCPGHRLTYLTTETHLAQP